MRVLQSFRHCGYGSEALQLKKARAGDANHFAILRVIGSCISLQLGAALAVQLFDDGGT